jgi:hypothetical protein
MHSAGSSTNETFGPMIDECEVPRIKIIARRQRIQTGRAVHLVDRD